MNSLSEHPKCYKRLSLMKEMWSKKIAHGFGQKQYGYRCGFLAWQSPGGSAVAMFKNLPIHMWLPNSNTDPQHGYQICSNDAFLSWTSEMLQNALSNEREVINKIYHGFGREQYGYPCGSLALQPPGGSSIAMFKNTPFQGQWPCWKDTLVTGDFPMVLQIFDIESKLRNSLLLCWLFGMAIPCNHANG